MIIIIIAPSVSIWNLKPFISNIFKLSIMMLSLMADNSKSLGS